MPRTRRSPARRALPATRTLLPWVAGLLLAGLLGGCEALPGEEEVCTMELRVNHCVTVDGSRDIPAGLTVVRERGTVRDTLGKYGQGGNCFDEVTGRFRLLAFRGDTLVKALPPMENATVDGCHGAPRIDDIAL